VSIHPEKAFWDEPETEIIVPNEEISGLIFDAEFGIRWKNGAFDRKMKGDKKAEKEPRYVYTPTSVSSKELDQFISRYMTVYDDVQELMVDNSVVVMGIYGDEISYYDKALMQVVDINCSGVTKAQFSFFMYRMKLGFMKHCSTMLNTLATAAMYAKFTGVKEGTIRKWMDRGKLELVAISGVKFIFISEDELILWNAFLMEEAARSENCGNRKQLQGYYKKLYGQELPVPPDSIKDFFASRCMYPTNVDGECWKDKYFTAGAYILYDGYCDEVGIEPVPIRTFALRITEMGFKRFNGRKRGFYYWKGDSQA